MVEKHWYAQKKLLILLFTCSGHPNILFYAYSHRITSVCFILQEITSVPSWMSMWIYLHDESLMIHFLCRLSSSLYKSLICYTLTYHCCSMKQMPGISSRMSPLPVSINNDLVSMLMTSTRRVSNLAFTLQMVWIGPLNSLVYLTFDVKIEYFYLSLSRALISFLRVSIWSRNQETDGGGGVGEIWFWPMLKEISTKNWWNGSC